MLQALVEEEGHSDCENRWIVCSSSLEPDLPPDIFDRRAAIKWIRMEYLCAV